MYQLIANYKQNFLEGIVFNGLKNETGKGKTLISLTFGCQNAECLCASTITATIIMLSLILSSIKQSVVASLFLDCLGEFIHPAQTKKSFKNKYLHTLSFDQKLIGQTAFSQPIMVSSVGQKVRISNVTVN
jgi:hypothetical protein